MATYNKRGYKQPKPEAEVVENQTEQVEEVTVEHSTTAEVFDTLDEKAGMFEDFIARNQKYIYGFVGAVAIAASSYLLYDKFVAEPHQLDAANEMFQAQQYFEQAVGGVASDSLYNLALVGGEGKLGFLKIIEDYSGTDAANLAEYYAGLSYLNTGKFKDAIAHLEKYSAKDKITSALSKGAIGDAFMENNQKEEALKYYIKASESDSNEFTAPLYLFKAGQVSMDLNKKADALKYFTKIKEQFPMSQEAASIDGYIAAAE